MKTTHLFAVCALIITQSWAITPNSVELELGSLIRTHASQNRPQMIHDPVLNAVARAKASDMAQRSYVSHKDPDGLGPNRVVQLVGYDLPEWYGTDRDANYIESIGLAPPAIPAQKLGKYRRYDGSR